MLILASQSPRRQELLRLITTRFNIVAPDTDETVPPGCPPEQAAEVLALRKARAVAKTSPGNMVIGADTIVELNGVLLGKPETEAHALEMLTMLSGRTHRVFTGVAICAPGTERSFTQETAVTFWDMGEAWLRRYIATGEPMDKAGAYGIQQQGALLVREIHGDYFNVVGLPVSRLARVLEELAPAGDHACTP